MEFQDLFIYSETDINAETVKNAFYWTSFDSDRRVITERRMYVNDMESYKTQLILAAKTDAQKDEAVKCFEYIKKKYLELRNVYYSAQSRCASSVITGGSGFNVGRAEKTNNISHNREGEFWKFREGALDTALLRVNNLSDEWRVRGAIKSNDENALQLLNEKLTDLKTEQEKMKQANKLVKGSFKAFELTNNNATIKNTENRIADVTRKQNSVTKETQRENGLKIVENVELDRLQMFFNGKPSVEIIYDLKKSGFRWSPTNICWQAFLTNAGKFNCSRILAKHSL